MAKTIPQLTDATTVNAADELIKILAKNKVTKKEYEQAKKEGRITQY
jgi:hypothetical protein